MPRNRVLRAICAIRLMSWLTEERASRYRLIILIVSACLVVGMVMTARDGISFAGKPLGTDYLAFWSASTLALNGEAMAAYDLGRIYAVEKAAVPVDPGPSSFLYPPPFLLLCLPLGLAPYLISLAMWLVITGVVYGFVARRWLAEHPGAARRAALTIFAFPAVLVNIGHGQNGFLTAALLGGGLWLIDRKPWIAGVLLGALIIKPQIAFGVPVLVLASGRWRVAAAGVATALLLCTLSLLVLGSDPWLGFLSGSRLAREILEMGLVEPGKMISAFAAIQVVGGGSALAYAVQALVAVGAALTLVVVAKRSDVPPGGHAAVCAATTTLMSPFFLDYDLTILAFPLAWLLCEGLRRDFLPWEKAVLASAYLLPLFARNLALSFSLPIAPMVLVMLTIVCVRAAVWARGENETNFSTVGGGATNWMRARVTS